MAHTLLTFALWLQTFRKFPLCETQEVVIFFTRKGQQILSREALMKDANGQTTFAFFNGRMVRYDAPDGADTAKEHASAA